MRGKFGFRPRMTGQGTKDRAFVTLALGLLISGATFGPASADSLFEASYYSFDLGLGTSDAALADLDGDSRFDVVATNRYSGTLTVRLGLEDGTFGERRDFAAGDTLEQLLLADVNHDSWMDALTIEWPRGVSLLVGNGDGSFAPPSRIRTPTYPFDIVCADLVGDANLDLAVASSDSVRLLEGDGQGGFEATRNLAFAARLAAGDFDGDGRMDLVTTRLDSLQVLLAADDGSFEPQPYVVLPSFASGVRTADLDADGRLDLVVVYRTIGALSIFLGAGNGEFEARPALTDVDGPADVVIRDVDADGHLDVAVCGGYTSTLCLYRGTGDGTFDPPLRYATGPGPTSIMAADLSGDGRIDLATVGGYNPAALAVKVQNPDGTLGQGLVFTPPQSTGELTMCDVDSDGNLDIASTMFQKIWISPGHGDGNFGPARELSFSVGPRVESILLVDLNGDARLDLVAAWGSVDVVSVLLQQGDGSFDSRIDYAVGWNPQRVAAGDVNSDGRIDLVVANRLSAFSILLGNGDGSFQPKFDRGRPADRVALTDLNRDGKLDLVYTGYPNLLFARLGIGDASFGIEYSYATGPEPRQLLIADLNDDDWPDAIVNPVSRTVTVYFGNGDGTFGQQTDIPVRYRPESIALADLNGDRRLDLAAACYGSGVVAVRLGNGDGTFRDDLDYGTVNDPRTLAAGDVNGDSRPDLVCLTDFLGPGTVLWNRNKATPIMIEDLQAERLEGAIHLSWKLSLEASQRARHVRVQRSEAPEGPFINRCTDLVPRATMECEDGEILSDMAYWYRVVITTSDGIEYVSASALVPKDGTRLFALDLSPLPEGNLGIQYQIGGTPGDVQLAVFDVRGRRVRLLDSGRRDIGRYRCTWDRCDGQGNRVAGGLYLVRLAASGRSITRKTALVR